MADTRFGGGGLLVLTKPPLESRLGSEGLLVLTEPTPELKVGFLGIDVITQSSPDTSSVAAGTNLEVLLQNDPATVAGSTHVEVLLAAEPSAELSWLGGQALISVSEDSLVQAQVSWLGSQVLVDATQNFNIGWLGAQALVDVRVYDDIPDDISVPTLFDAIPGETYVEGPYEITGLTPGATVEITSDEDITISVNGADPVANPTVSEGDLIELHFVVQNLFTDGVVYAKSVTGDHPFITWPVTPIDGRVEPVHLGEEVSSQWVEYKRNDSALATMSGSGRFIINSGTGTPAPSSNFSETAFQTTTPAPSARHQGVFTQLEIVGWTSSNRAGFNGAYSQLSFAREFELVTDSKEGLVFSPVSAYSAPHAIHPYDPAPLFETSIFGSEHHPGFEHRSVHTLSPVSLVWLQETPHDYHPVSPVWEIAHDPLEREVNPVWGYQAAPDLELFIPEVRAYTFAVYSSYIPVDLDFDRWSARADQTIDIQSRSGQSDKFLTVTMGARAQTLRVWNADNYVVMGGFATQEEAIAEVTSLYGSSSYVIYEQPEGTYSYLIEQDTGLVCSLSGVPGLRAVAWLLGGG